MRTCSPQSMRLHYLHRTKFPAALRNTPKDTDGLNQVETTEECAVKQSLHQIKAETPKASLDSSLTRNESDILIKPSRNQIENKNCRFYLRIADIRCCITSPSVTLQRHSIRAISKGFVLPRAR